MHAGSPEVTSPPPASAPHARASWDRIDPLLVARTDERLLLESARHLETMLCRFRYAVAAFAVTMATVFRPSWLAFAVALLIAPVSVNLYVHRTLRRSATLAQPRMRRLGRNVLAADAAMTFATFFAFLTDTHAIPAAFMPLIVFELAARFHRRGIVLGLAVAAAAIGLRVFFQTHMLSDGALRSPLLLVWSVLTVLMLVLATELRQQDSMRFTASQERERIAESFRTVISDVLTRSGVSPQAASRADVLDAVRRICDERTGECAALSAGIADLLVPAAREFGLTRREREIVHLLAMGHSYDRIARMLSVSASTVRNHLHNVRAKLNLSSREEVVAFAREQGLVPLQPHTRPHYPTPRGQLA